jgi:hypothetical protein
MAMHRVRHCAECPKCHNRYLLGSSPYANGSYMVPLSEGFSAGWILYCSCSTPPTSSQWSWTELKRYGISGQAHRRGYGSPEEISDLEPRWQDQIRI